MSEQNYCLIKSVLSKKYLDVLGASQDESVPVVQYSRNHANYNGDNQVFLLIPCGDDYYYLQAKHSGKFLNIIGESNADGVNLVQFHLTNQNNIKFKFIQTTPGNYKIQVKHSGKFLTVKDESLADLANIVQCADNGRGSQIFNLEFL